MLYIGPVDIPGSDDHEGFVSARTADGRDTGIWTDVRSGPGYTGFRAGCECGWLDDGFCPPDPGGHRAALDAFVHRHFATVAGRDLDPQRDFLPPWAVPGRPGSVP
ncbi:hypothetical protein [Pseudonocardia sp. HH130630-07]|uniref:hypothetical protein n=1 Tax=Pseudonocardia sp. HH130630-07 TaxID=1690815 RepID=UPI000815285E|nr:hypothetical protein [Pseudonocardia sp. HH130630-07]ANY09275.1 hypothetical protein AFB00_26920 [Pseudonocardia sp. HH130630-07]